MTLFPREQEQELTAERIGDVPQIQEETVEEVKTALEEQISERSEAIKVPKISPDMRQAFVDRVEAENIALQERIFEGMRDQTSREYFPCYFKLWEWWSLQHTTKRVLAEVDKTIRRKRISERSQVFDVPRTSCRGGTTF